MSHFMLRWQFKDAAAKVLVNKPQDRTGPAKTLVEGFGGKLHGYYFAFGDYDGVIICEFPDSTSAAACSMTAAATGAFSRFETTPLLTAKEAEAALKRAHDTKTGYTPPHA
ncbi:MAG TPA: GYD domain-containing protein [Acetobacteraceae bacterium]|nr:GYD domain-containing protein [Acetobacteraceae bacterium]